MPEIVVLDGRDVPNPEDMAMLLALYSRSPKSVRLHLEQVKKRGSSNFMSIYYAGYGHKSIGDCGTTAICFENVSMLAAKAVQDSPLYCGQEASTRYLDTANQAVLNPLGLDEGRALQAEQMALYSEVLESLIAEFRVTHPRKPDEPEKDWEKAIKAKAFDIARSLLPAGATTYVAWAGNLRQVADHGKELRNHPLPEIPAMWAMAEGQLVERYSSSFSTKRYGAEEDYVQRSMARFAYFDDPAIARNGFQCEHRLDRDALKAHLELLSTRPPKAELHQRFRQFGYITFKFLLDFGSYRDLQRQRSAVQEMPLLTTNYGFHEWYLKHLPVGTEKKIDELRRAVDRLPGDPMTKQYYTPMGYLVPVVLTCPLPAAVYIAELRSGQTVHPTLRTIAQGMGETLKAVLPYLAMHHDMTPDAWSIKRGAQDIVKKS